MSTRNVSSLHSLYIASYLNTSSNYVHKTNSIREQRPLHSSWQTRFHTTTQLKNLKKLISNKELDNCSQYLIQCLWLTCMKDLINGSSQRGILFCTSWSILHFDLHLNTQQKYRTVYNIYFLTNNNNSYSSTHYLISTLSLTLVLMEVSCSYVIVIVYFVSVSCVNNQQYRPFVHKDSS